jgi:hypothetical protein
MEYLLYTILAVILLLSIFRYLNKKGDDLLNIFWDGYNIYVRTGSQEARAALVIGLTTVSKQHKTLLIECIEKDLEEFAFEIYICRQDHDPESYQRTLSIFPNIEAFKNLTEDDVLELKKYISVVRELIDNAKKLEHNVKFSLVTKEKFKNDFPELVSSINKFNHLYFRKIHSSYNAPFLKQRIHAWKFAENLKDK